MRVNRRGFIKALPALAAGVTVVSQLEPNKSPFKAGPDRYEVPFSITTDGLPTALPCWFNTGDEFTIDGESRR